MSTTLRQFKCRDDLWQRVEALADRRGISTDEVVQAAILQLFSRKKSSTENPVQAASGATPGRSPNEGERGRGRPWAPLPTSAQPS